MSRDAAATVGDRAFAPLAEHSLVRLRRAAPLDDGRSVPAGTVGAIVGVWGEGAAYLVEFALPAAAIATVAAQDLVQATEA